MKKLTILTAIVLSLALSLVSCKEEVTVTAEYTFGFDEWTNTPSIEVQSLVADYFANKGIGPNYTLTVSTGSDEECNQYALDYWSSKISTVRRTEIESIVQVNSSFTYLMKCAVSEIYPDGIMQTYTFTPTN